MKTMNIRFAEIQDVLCVKMQQESTTYRVESVADKSELPPSCVTMYEHEEWRPLVMEWMYQIFGNDSPSIVATAAYYLDTIIYRGRIAPSEYQLVALTCIYVAIKAREQDKSKHMTLDELIDLARRQGTTVSREDVLDAECFLAQDLNYNMRPPTAHCFVRMYLDLIVELVSVQDDAESIRSDLEMAADYFVQDVITGGCFTLAQPSLMAYAAMLVALEDYVDLPSSSENLQRLFVTALRRMTGVGSATHGNGLLDLLTDMSDSSSAASTCLGHVEEYEDSMEQQEQQTMFCSPVPVVIPRQLLKRQQPRAAA